MQPFDQARIARALTEAAVDPSRWNHALETVVTCTGSFGACVLPVEGAMPFVTATEAMAPTMEVYIRDRWYERDERYRGKASFLRNGVVTDDHCMPREERRHSPYYQEFLAALGINDFGGIRVGRSGNVWNISVQRTAEQGTFSESELQCLAQLSNTLDPVVEISLMLGRARGESALDAFEFSERAAVLVNRFGEVVRANAQADALLGDDLEIKEGRLAGRRPQQTDLINRKLRQLFWDDEASLKSPIVIAKAAGGKLVIYPMRLPGLTASPLSAFHAVLVLTDMDGPQSASLGTLRSVFDFTTAEARLAMALVTGGDLGAFAVERGLSKETVRHQLKAVFAKTGTNRQAQLTAMLAKLISER